MSKVRVDQAPGGNFTYDPGPPPSDEDVVMAVRAIYGVTLSPERARKVWRRLQDKAYEILMTRGTRDE